MYKITCSITFSRAVSRYLILFKAVRSVGREVGRDHKVKEKNHFQILDVDYHYTHAKKAKQLHNVLNTYFKAVI